MWVDNLSENNTIKQNGDLASPSKRRKKKRKRKPIKISKVSLVVLIISLIIVFNLGSIASGLRGLISFGNIKIENSYTYEFKSNFAYENSTVVDYHSDYTLIKDGGHLTYYDDQMNGIWEKDINGQDIILKSKGSLIVTADKLTGDVYVLDKKGEIVGKQLGMGKISDIILNSEEIFLVDLRDDGKYSIIDNKGNLVSDILVPNSVITDVDVSPKTGLIAFSMFKVENETIFSSVLTYDKDGELTGIMNKENQVIYDIKALDDSVVIVTDQGLSRYNSMNESMYEEYVFDRELKTFAIDDTGNVIANLIIESKDITDTRSDNVLKIISPMGKEIIEQDMENEIQKIICNGTDICYYADSKLYVLDFKGAVLGIQMVKEDPQSIRWIDDSNIGIVYTDSFQVFTLK